MNRKLSTSLPFGTWEPYSSSAPKAELAVSTVWDCKRNITGAVCHVKPQEYTEVPAAIFKKTSPLTSQWSQCWSGPAWKGHFSYWHEIYEGKKVLRLAWGLVFLLHPLEREILCEGLSMMLECCSWLCSPYYIPHTIQLSRKTGLRAFTKTGLLRPFPRSSNPHLQPLYPNTVFFPLRALITICNISEVFAYSTVSSSILECKLHWRRNSVSSLQHLQDPEHNLTKNRCSKSVECWGRQTVKLAKFNFQGVSLVRVPAGSRSRL